LRLGEFLLYGVCVRMTGNVPGAADPSFAAGRSTSASRTTPSSIVIGTLVVLLIWYVAGRGFQVDGCDEVDATTGVATISDPATDRARDLRDSMPTPSTRGGVAPATFPPSR
jgi:hypothetical protein